MKYLVAIILISTILEGFSQEADSLELDYIGDSIYDEELPNYLGINFTPIVTSVAGGIDNQTVKFSAIYKRNLGLKNLRTSVNYITYANQTPYLNRQVIATTDTSYTSRFYNADLKNYNVRFGFEELKGYRYSRLHIGADLILGYSMQSQTYNERTSYLDSSGNYIFNTDEPAFNTGQFETSYFTTGIDVSFGFDWFLSENFLLTFQLTPEFNVFMPIDDSEIDPLDLFGDPSTYADFKLGFFDVMLFYKF